MNPLLSNGSFWIGLTGVGIAPPAALAAVFLYRLATFWLPIAPGFVSFRYLTAREML